MADLEIERMLVLSTGHLTEATANTLPRDGNDERSVSWGPSFSRDEGWLFHVGMDTTDAPEDLRSALAFARSNGCAWVLFDRDGPTVDELSYHTW